MSVSVVLWVSLLALLSSSSSLYAVPVTVTVNANGTLAGGSAVAIPFTATGTANSVPYGNAAFSATGTAVLPAGANAYTAAGSFRLDFGGGNVLTADFAMPATALFPLLGGAASGVGTAVVTGGTGTFAGASGNFPLLTGAGTATGPSTSTFAINASGDVVTPNNQPPPTSAALRFVPVTPCRIADTRNAPGPFGGPLLAATTVRDFPVPQSACNIPATARAYSLNVTVVTRGALAFLTIFPTGQQQPLVSTLNSFDGRIKANAAIVPAGTGGSISVFATNQTDVILDINGYFIPPDGVETLSFFPVTPCRIVDTRNPIGPALPAGQIRTFTVAGPNCGIPATAKAYALNMTVIPTGPFSYLTTWPSDKPQPLASTLNAPTGTIVANAALVPASPTGTINIYVTDPADLVLDVTGYFAPHTDGGLSFYTVNPCRLSDTRNPAGQFGGPALAAGQTRNYPVLATPCGLLGSARAYSLNATVVPPSILAFLTLWPNGQGQPQVSTLNAFDGAITSNAAIVPAGNDGSINAFVTNLTDLILDVNGYFAP
jgi:hypothetical protein